MSADVRTHQCNDIVYDREHWLLCPIVGFIYEYRDQVMPRVSRAEELSSKRNDIPNDSGIRVPYLTAPKCFLGRPGGGIFSYMISKSLPAAAPFGPSSFSCILADLTVSFINRCSNSNMPRASTNEGSDNGVLTSTEPSNLIPYRTAHYRSCIDRPGGGISFYSNPDRTPAAVHFSIDFDVARMMIVDMLLTPLLLTPLVALIKRKRDVPSPGTPYLDQQYVWPSTDIIQDAMKASTPVSSHRPRSFMTIGNTNTAPRSSGGRTLFLEHHPSPAEAFPIIRCPLRTSDTLLPSGAALPIGHGRSRSLLNSYMSIKNCDIFPGTSARWVTLGGSVTWARRSTRSSTGMSSSRC